jgi:hypothetical protein
MKQIIKDLSEGQPAENNRSRRLHQSLVRTYIFILAVYHPLTQSSPGFDQCSALDRFPWNLRLEYLFVRRALSTPSPTLRLFSELFDRHPKPLSVTHMVQRHAELVDEHAFATVCRCDQLIEIHWF